ncbi:hypothetical protein F4859DRAFT_512477 [Xylaria cf. heliscus]|nr:hypothetical protein F4859DRAFT_512477 [Xylaria cf. heliscus]
MSGSPPSDGVMDISNLMDKDKAAVVAAAAAAAAAASVSALEQQQQQQQHQQHQQHQQQQPHTQSQLMTHQHLQPATFDRANSPHGSEASYHSAHRPYGSPSAVPGQLPLPDPNIPANMMMAGLPPVGQAMAMPYNKPPEAPQPPIKAYPCSTCTKRFARRSDLARHERIHSGIRPHVCDYAGCGKQFIQRSALTVHQRVHTGEKPHMCERCGKPFSDSSSLARHRRIHSGTRPYQCLYANCLKTFTRKTTLTRHQLQHTETLEEAAVATAKKLTEQASKMAATGSVRSDGGEAPLNSNHASPLNTPSPGHRHMSTSPGADPAGPNTMRPSDYSFMGNGTLPSHLRADIHTQTPTSMGSFTPGMRPTSHPTNYPPPPTLEPNIESHNSTGGSTAGSPHMGSVGWQSPSHVQSPSHMPSPTYSNNGGSGSVYPDLEPSFAGNALSPMYSYSTQVRRGNSTEPPSSTYDVKPRPSELWAGQ